jgi:hypothetical protein
MGVLWREHVAQEKVKALHFSLSMAKYFMDHKIKDAGGGGRSARNLFRKPEGKTPLR